MVAKLEDVFGIIRRFVIFVLVAWREDDFVEMKRPFSARSGRYCMIVRIAANGFTPVWHDTFNGESNVVEGDAVAARNCWRGGQAGADQGGDRSSDTAQMSTFLWASKAMKPSGTPRPWVKIMSGWRSRSPEIDVRRYRLQAERGQVHLGHERRSHHRSRHLDQPHGGAAIHAGRDTRSSATTPGRTATSGCRNRTGVDAAVDKRLRFGFSISTVAVRWPSRDRSLSQR